MSGSASIFSGIFGKKEEINFAEEAAAADEAAAAAATSPPLAAAAAAASDTSSDDEDRAINEGAAEPAQNQRPGSDTPVTH